MSETGRSGRWRTGQQNKQRIIDAAREHFMRDGYEKATVRSIAADAGVDVAMVYYHFGNKEGLFTASVLDTPQHPLHQLANLLEEGPGEIGARLVRDVVQRWDAGASFDLLLTVFRSADIHPLARKLLHDTLAGPVAQQIAEQFGVDNAELRVELVTVHLVGLAFARYQLKIEPMASASIDDLAAWIGPTVQRYLTDPNP
ncbi:TetR/AcrR family transcriptional regulator [Mycolicibacterium fortuitum]|jgi:AcrR family transcriptional regulator|uniref:TetR family regulator n=3 Tax=Mycolicibacterium fortuitum TaxID=1766 RepID=A0A0N9XHZ7_MYCFO|nr:TetR family transcriptional regulator [Mycolicibacterium fortuitum]AIY45917.1 Transcriptional regulator, TetR family [Mycobacterium sp. VKM Ac-1817D]CRL81429.1 transcriptional regulator [Mycolicibacter nonchromogenicus]ALI25997.1 Transcriptional regulator, TetR family [Mycolicibacterium fortuitum]AMD54507.1 TetR family transcriptional regulator [Mycolicibacterium fortuitum subsp. fortuitum DSM 46621 = ATCC 6841 = JCM 6387]EJZ15076.1 transcriptional regulator [Mycolicibacterium fortuitum sub